MSEEDNSDEMVKINEYVPSPHRMTFICERNSGVNASKCNLPLEFRWNVTPHDLEQIWLLSENVIECKYSWSLYKDILEKANLSLGVYTTVEAYREFVNEEMSTLRYRGKAKNEENITLSKEHTKINNTNITKPFDAHSEYLELPEYTDNYNIERVSRIRFELNKLIKRKSSSSSSSSTWSSMLLSPSHWCIPSSLSAPVSRLLATLKRASDESKTPMSHAEYGSNEKSKECNKSNDENAKYMVCVGFVTGRIGYASITVPNFDKAGRPIDVNQGQKIISLSTCKLCVNPTGYIGLVEVLPKMQKCGLGSVMLQTYIQFMTHRMPLHANTYLHYDIHRMELLISRCQEGTTPIHTNKNNNNDDSKIDGDNNCIENTNEEEHNTCTENSATLTTKSLVESDELCSLMDADTLNPVMQYGVREVWLHCLASEEKVVSFYSKNNFKEGKRCFNYYNYSENKKEALLMLYCTPAANTNAAISKYGSNENTSCNQKEIVHTDGKYKAEVLQTIDEMPLDVSSLLLQEEIKEKQKCEGTMSGHDMLKKEDSVNTKEVCQNSSRTNDTQGSNSSHTSMNTTTKHYEWLTPSQYEAIHDVNIESTKKVRSEWLQAQNEQVINNYGIAAVANNNSSISGGKAMSSKRVNRDMMSGKDAVNGNTWKDWLLCANALFLLASVLYCCYMSFTFRQDEIQVNQNNVLV